MPFRRNLPAIPPSISAAVKAQLSDARKKAYYHPSAENLGRLGMAFHSSSNYDQANQCYSLAIKQKKSERIWHYYLGYLYLENGDSEKAATEFSEVVKLDPKVTSAWYYLGKAYGDLAMYGKAEEALGKIADSADDDAGGSAVRNNYSPWSVSAKCELARIWLNTDRIDEAVNVLLAVSGDYHKIAPVYRLLGEAYFAKNDQALGNEFMTRVNDLAKVTPVNDTLIDRLSMISRSELYLLPRIEDAVKSANPEWAYKLIRHALVYLGDNKYIISKAVKFLLVTGTGKEALQYLDKDLTGFRDDFSEMTYVGDQLYSRGFSREALKFHLQAVKLKPADNEIRTSVAIDYLKAGREDSATVLMSDLYKSNSHDVKVLANEAAFMLMLGKKEDAGTFVSKLRQFDPGNPKIPKLAGMIARAEGNDREALRLFREALRKDPADMETIRGAFVLMESLKMWEDALQLLRSSLEYNLNEPFLLEKLGTLLVTCPDKNLRNTGEGIKYSERAFYHVSGNAGTLVSSGVALAQGNAVLGDFRKADYYITISLKVAAINNMPEGYIRWLGQFAARIRESGRF